MKVHPLARGVGLLDEQPLFVRLGRHGHEQPLPLSAVAVHRLVRRSCAAAGVPERLAHPHALRAYWATHCLEAGVSVHEVSARLGHVDLRTTARYAATAAGAHRRDRRCARPPPPGRPAGWRDRIAQLTAQPEIGRGLERARSGASATRRDAEPRDEFCSLARDRSCERRLMSWCGVRLSDLVEREWQPGTPEDKQRARAALAGALDGWLVAGDALLTPEGGWPLGPPASSSEPWSAILYLIAHASDAVAPLLRGRHAPRER